MTVVRFDTVLIDTGPLVVLLHSDDNQHAACEEVTKSLRLPLYSCWPVITEAAYLLRRSPAAVSTLLAYCNGSLIKILPVDKADLPAIDFTRHRRHTPQIRRPVL